MTGRMAGVDGTRLEFGLALDFGTERTTLNRVLDDYVPLLHLAEGHGFRTVWAGESFPSRPGAFHLPSPLLVLAALAPRTSLRLGTGVTLLPLWNPLRLAYDAAVLDQLTGGRLTVGVGAGSPHDWVRFGVERQTVGRRMDEMLAALKALWRGEDSFRGEVVSVERGVWPRPAQRGGPPLWVGGRVPRTAVRAARHGDAWYAATQYLFREVADGAARYRAALQHEGRDPQSAIVSVNRLCVLDDEHARAEAVGGPYVERVLDLYARIGALVDPAGTRLPPGEPLLPRVRDDVCLLGSPETVAVELERYVAAGVTHVQLRVAPGDMPADLVARTIRLAGERLLPRFA